MFHKTLLISLFTCSVLTEGKVSSPPLVGHPKAERTVNATLWYQTSGEFVALSHQAFNLARLRLDQALKNKEGTSPKPPAVVVDVDETILDNSPYQARAILTGETYPTGWDNWINIASAKPLPGAADFLKYAASKGVTVFYITNRKTKNHQNTLRNIKSLHLPLKEDEHLMTRDKESSKKTRREKVLKNYSVVLLIGDTLSDFHEIFDHKSSAKRRSQAEKMKGQFGLKFIILPNSTYGDWEASLFKYRYDLSPSKRAETIRKTLRSY